MRKIHTIIMCFAALTFAACSETGAEPEKASSVELSQNSIVAGPEGGSYTITVTSSEAWRVGGKVADWVTLSADSGQSGSSLKVDVAANESGDVLETSFKVFAGYDVKEVTIQSNPSFFVTAVGDVKADFTSDGGSLRVQIETNIPEFEASYSGDGASWIHYEGKEDIFGQIYLKFTVDASEVYLNRESAVTMSGNEKTLEFTVSQAQLDAILTEKDNIETGLGAGNVTVTVRHNVDIDELSVPEWVEVSDVKTDAQAAADGLKTSVYTLNLTESRYTRYTDLSFKSSGAEFVKVRVKQQNPNPVMAEITDAAFREILSGMGWILTEEGSTSCEILGPGFEATALNMVNSSSWAAEVGTIDGLGAFPALTEISIQTYNIGTLDLSDCKNISTLKLSEITALTELKLGSNPVTEIVLESDYYTGYLENETLTISGENITTLSLASDSSYIRYYEELTTLDVTGCPALTSLNAKRECQSYNWNTGGYVPVCNLETIYVTAAQQSAIDAGTLTVEKSDLTSIAVK